MSDGLIPAGWNVKQLPQTTVLVAEEAEQVAKMPEGGRHTDGSLTLSPAAARKLMEQITGGNRLLRSVQGDAKYLDNWLDEMAELLDAQGLQWEIRT